MQSVFWHSLNCHLLVVETRFLAKYFRLSDNSFNVFKI